MPLCKLITCLLKQKVEEDEGEDAEADAEGEADEDAYGHYDDRNALVKRRRNEHDVSQSPTTYDLGLNINGKRPLAPATTAGRSGTRILKEHFSEHGGR